MVLTAILIVMILAVAGLAVREIGLFFKDEGEFRLRRLTLRLLTAFLLIILLGSVLAALRVPVFYLENPEIDPAIFLAFWGCIGLLAGGIVMLVIADLNLIGVETERHTNRYWQEIAETIAQHKHEEKKETHDGDK